MHAQGIGSSQLFSTSPGEAVKARKRRHVALEYEGTPIDVRLCSIDRVIYNPSVYFPG